MCTEMVRPAGERHRPSDEGGPGLARRSFQTSRPTGPRMGSESGKPAAAAGEGGKASGDPAAVRFGVGRLYPSTVVGDGWDRREEPQGDRESDSQRAFVHRIPPAGRPGTLTHCKSASEVEVRVGSRFEVSNIQLEPQASSFKPQGCQPQDLASRQIELVQHESKDERFVVPGVVAAGGAAMAGTHLGLERIGLLPWLTVRSRATHLAGSQ